MKTRQPLAYRPDVDGLRALAVVAVVLFHYGVPGFSGGYVGVDVFFVISGYLITSIIAGELRENSFSLLDFFERRVRRILPLLLVVIALVLSASFVLRLPPDYFREVALSAAAAASFLSNAYFWRSSGYFDAPAETQPLLHTWSVAVEEQFYIGLPLVMLFLWRRVRRSPVVGLCLLAVVSFVGSLFLLRRSPAAAFYLSPSRGWELMAGALLAFAPASGDRRPWSRDMAGVLGLALFAWAVYSFSAETVFPGATALVPCAAAALIVHAGRGPAVVTRLLSWKPLVALGLLSYGIYLFHWPILVLARFAKGNSLSVGESAAAIAVTVLLAMASRRLVEQPVRLRVLLPGRGAAFTAAAVGTAGVLALSLAGPAAHQRLFAESNARYTAATPPQPFIVCADVTPAELAERACRLGSAGAQSSFMVWGDSHAYALAPALDALGGRRGHAGRLVSNSGCAPLLVETMASKDEPLCAALNRAAIDLVQPDMTVFLVSRWRYYVDDERHPAEDVAREGTGAARMARGLESTVEAIRQRGANAVVALSPPVFPANVPVLHVRRGRVVVERSEHERITGALNREIARVAEEAGARWVALDTPFCDSQRCTGASAEGIWFVDADHLSVPGTRLLEPVLAPVFPRGGRAGSRATDHLAAAQRPAGRQAGR